MACLPLYAPLAARVTIAASPQLGQFLGGQGQTAGVRQHLGLSVTTLSPPPQGSCFLHCWQLYFPFSTRFIKQGNRK